MQNTGNTVERIVSDFDIDGPKSIQGRNAQEIVSKNLDQSVDTIQAILERNGYRRVSVFHKEDINEVRRGLLAEAQEEAKQEDIYYENDFIDGIDPNFDETNSRKIICESQTHIFLIIAGQGVNPKIH